MTKLYARSTHDCLTDKLLWAVFLGTALLCSPAFAGDTAGGKPNDLAEANNPLANFTALNVHNYYIGKLTDLDDEDANQAWARFAMPFSIGDSLWIMRASLPFNTFPVGPDLDSGSGLGDLNVFAARLFDTGNPALTVGVGPQITAPTATKDELGSEKWSGGLVHTLFNITAVQDNHVLNVTPCCKRSGRAFWIGSDGGRS